MNELMPIIRGRRSIRRYQQKEVPGEDLEQILDAVRWAPSWANTQCWEVIVIKKQEIKERLRDTLSSTNPAREAMIEAPMILALCAKLHSSGFYKEQAATKFGDWFMFDLGIATQDICLMAHRLGLGTVIVGLFDHDRAKKVLEIGEGFEVVVLLPLGYSAKDARETRRREIKEFLHHERF